MKNRSMYIYINDIEGIEKNIGYNGYLIFCLSQKLSEAP